ncbi:citrinin biosynthesis oxygenase CtnA [Hypoxylon trugodes]|uniref:citrinin biosynthesis oxygenase CtnA n=1 Tax=Hypoxylon trugodes TaxID=326681 RepID=UPI0021924F66|nr:citrinin biosynthesis oxygenase CtnA [Hypoxylon trugodes]KAI1394379.1 citrinin biosynthesis oxygenase CtnA [Hypoxylon trugodes]
MPSATTKSSFYLPLVDITPWLQDPNSAAGQQVIDDVRAACRSSGFFQMKGHGISRELQQAVFDASARFFALPPDEKLKMDCRKSIGFRGYDVMASQSYEPTDGSQILRDHKEGFFASADLPLDHPRVVNERFLQGPNVWPPAELLPYKDFRDIVERYYGEMMHLAHLVLDLVAATLPYGPHVFDELKGNDPMWLFRLLHYPQTPVREGGGKMQLGAGEHTDFGAVTLLATDEHPGLEVQDHETGEWVRVPPNDGVYIVNLGDVMSKITEGEYRSSVHRVWNKSSDDRYSIVFFFDGNLDFKLRPLSKLGQPEKGEERWLTVEEHVKARLTGSYGTKK